MNNQPFRGRLPAAVLALSSLAALAPCQCPMVADLTPGPGGNNIGPLCNAFDQHLYFSHITSAEGSELWRWTPGGTPSIVVDLNPGGANNAPAHITAACLRNGPGVIYSGWESGHGHELYWSDGTATGTGRLLEIRPGSGSSLPHDFLQCVDKVFFVADDGPNGNELWVTDGTPAGTKMVLDINPGGANSNPQHLTLFGDRILFRASDGSSGEELWVSNGTAAGTMMVTDLHAGSSGSHPWGMTRIGDFVYFAADDGVAGNELWRTDGTAAGTSLVAEIWVGGNGTTLNDFVACNDCLLFTSTWFHEYGIHSYDTVTGTRTFLGVDGHTLTRSGNRVFFSGGGFPNGTEIWVTDGTLAGTQEVADLNPGSPSSNPFRLVDVGNGVLFVATTTSSGEFWFSDGTQAGTALLCTSHPNVNPERMVMCNGHLFYLGYTAAAGRELMWFPTPGASSANLGGQSRPDLPALGFEDGTAPNIGSSVDLVATGPSHHAGVLLGSTVAAPTAQVSIPGLIDGGYDNVGLTAGTALTFGTALTTNWSWTLNVPNDPNLEGFGLHLQMLWLGGSSPTFQWSNGVRATIGPPQAH